MNITIIRDMVSADSILFQGMSTSHFRKLILQCI